MNLACYAFRILWNGLYISRHFIWELYTNDFKSCSLSSESYIQLICEFWEILIDMCSFLRSNENLVCMFFFHIWAFCGRKLQALKVFNGIDRHGGEISPITGFFLHVSSSEVRDRWLSVSMIFDFHILWFVDWRIVKHRPSLQVIVKIWDPKQERVVNIPDENEVCLPSSCRS